MSRYQESYFGPAVGPLKIDKDSIIVISNNDTHEYGTAKLGHETFLCKSLPVYTSSHKDLFFGVLSDPLDRYNKLLYRPL